VNRRGIASIWALVVLAVVSVMTTAIVGQFMVARRSLEARQNRAQAERLAEAGKELAISKLQISKDYTGEALKLLADGDVKIVVAADEKPDIFRITIESQFPTNQPRTVKVQIECVARRSGHRIEIVE
jgi:hypothetical protein